MISVYIFEIYCPVTPIQKSCIPPIRHKSTEIPPNPEKASPQTSIFINNISAIRQKIMPIIIDSQRGAVLKAKMPSRE